jgi:hypothetical protein
MSDADWNAIGDKLRRLKNPDEEDGRTGYINPSTGECYDDPCVGLASRRRVWVRFGAKNKSDPGRGALPVWTNNRVSTHKADIPVVVKLNKKGQWQVEQGDNEAVDVMGLPEGFFAGDPLPPELNSTALAVANLTDFKPIWDTVNGGLYVYVDPGWYNGSHWLGGSIDLAAYVTATASRKAWVVGGFDITTGALVAATSGNYYLSEIPTPEVGIATTFSGVTFNNAFAVFAVAIPNGATDNTGLTLVDIRGVVGATLGGSSGTFNADSILLNAYGEILTNGTNVLTNG